MVNNRLGDITFIVWVLYGVNQTLILVRTFVFYTGCEQKETVFVSQSFIVYDWRGVGCIFIQCIAVSVRTWNC